MKCLLISVLILIINISFAYRNAETLMSYNDTVCLLKSLRYSDNFIDSVVSKCALSPSGNSFNIGENPGYVESTSLTRDFSSEWKNFIAEAMQNITQLLARSIQPIYSDRIPSAPSYSVEPTLEKGHFEKLYPRNCYEIHVAGNKTTGVHTIYIDPATNFPTEVWCDQETEGGGWTVVTVRDKLPVRESFSRTWMEYVFGFGNASGEYFIGLENMHKMTSAHTTEVRIDLEDFAGVSKYAKYAFFHIGEGGTSYRLFIDEFTGTAGNSLNYHNRKKFSTWDNDISIGGCPGKYESGFWFVPQKSCGLHANINGRPTINSTTTTAHGIIWHHFKGQKYSLKKVQMKIRPVFPFFTLHYN